MPTKILIADDSATMRTVMEMTFAGEDAQVVSVGTGDACVTKAAEVQPDVIFADASLEGVDAYEIAKRVGPVAPREKRERVKRAGLWKVAPRAFR